MVSELDAAAALLNTRGSFVQLLVTLSIPVYEVLYGVLQLLHPISSPRLASALHSARLTPDVGTRIQQGLRATSKSPEPEPTLL
jgi:hypothetical protein